MTGTRLPPPPGYSTWLDYAVNCMDTRSLEQEELWIDDLAKRNWPVAITRKQMEQAVRDELAELRAKVVDPVKQRNKEALAQHRKPIINSVPMRLPLPAELMSFKNWTAIEEAGSAVCYHCLNWFRSERIVNWTDDGKSAICPICGIDSVLASHSDQPISLDLLIDYQQANFNVRELPQEQEVAEIRMRIEKVDKLEEELTNELPGFLSTNYPLFIETIRYRRPEANLVDITNWLLSNSATRIKLLIGGQERKLLRELFEEEAGVYL